MQLQLDNVSKSYADGRTNVRAVHIVSVQVTKGEFVAVQGPSGCGKSTLLLIAGALLKPDSGQVQINGQDPYALNPDARAEFRAGKIGFVFQQFHLVPYLSVLDNVLAPALGVAGSASDVRDRGLCLIERFGLLDRILHVPSKLSTGEPELSICSMGRSSNRNRNRILSFGESHDPCASDADKIDSCFARVPDVDGDRSGYFGNHSRRDVASEH